MSFLLANKLANATLLGTQLMRLLQEAYEASPELIDPACADLQAVYDRDPACDK
jgi:serine O-acetyltransferase